MSRSRHSLLAIFLLISCGGEAPPNSDPNAHISIQPVAEGISQVEVASPGRIAMSPRGTAFLSVRSEDELVVEVDTATGAILRTIGARGEGPGEYQSPGIMLFRGDSLLLQNSMDGSFSVYDGEGRFHRQFQGAVPVQAGRALVVRGESLLVAEPVSTPDAFGLPLHLLSETGVKVASFGSEDRTVEPGRYVPRLRVLARASDSSVWVARRDQYLIELWSTGGVMQRALAPVRDWFPTMTKDPGDPSLERPVTHLGGIHRDSHGHLIVVLLRSRADWKPRPRPESEAALDPYDKLGYFEVVIEVLDPTNGKLLASRIATDVRTAGDFLDNGLLVGYIEMQDQAPALALFQVTHH